MYIYMCIYLHIFTHMYVDILGIYVCGMYIYICEFIYMYIMFVDVV